MQPWATIHDAMIKQHCGDKLAGHVRQDSKVIQAREKPVKSKACKDSPKRKPGRPRKGEEVRAKPLKRLDLHPKRTLEESLSYLPSQCNVGTKKNSKGYKESWVGYKLHIDCIDGDIPVSAILTSTSLHDSQVAITLAWMSAKRITNLYGLMDVAYDAPQVLGFSESMGHKPINDNKGASAISDLSAERNFA